MKENKYIAKQSILTIIGFIILITCIIGSLICTYIDLNLAVSIFVFAVLGGVLIMVGLLSEK